MLQIRSLAVKCPAVAGAILSRFPDREALRLYVLEVAALLPEAAADEIAEALVANMGSGTSVRAPAGAPGASQREWDVIFNQP